MFEKEGKRFGLTCHHVANCLSSIKNYEAIGHEKVQYRTDELDFCFFEIADSSLEAFNLANLKFDQCVVRNLKEGELLSSWVASRQA